MHISIYSPGRTTPITYPPPQDIRYGELVRLRNLARKAEATQIAQDLQHRLDHFFDKPGPQMELIL